MGQKVESYQEGFEVVIRNTKWGEMTVLRPVISPKYGETGAFREGLSVDNMRKRFSGPKPGKRRDF